MTDKISREIRLKNRPVGLPSESDFELAEVAVPEVRDGELLVQNIYMSVDPYMRGRLNDRKSYFPPFQIGNALEGACVGRVTESKNGSFNVGDYVLSMLGWREYFVSSGAGLTKVDSGLAPVQAYLGAVGMTGMTAYVGLLHIGELKEGETVFVSAAAGAVGSMVCQIAKLKGCYVVGSAGSDEKVSWLIEEAGIDAAFNYKTADDVIAEVGEYFPNGIDVYFENVGGIHLEAALEHMNANGRIVMCGMISMYNAVKPVPGPVRLSYIISKKLTMKGFIVRDHYDKIGQFYAAIGKWLAEGKIKWKETIIDGIENAPQAFIGLFKGENFGKMIVKVGD
ncbi:Putative oxidoreductase YncB [Olavius sp. associated proteobacterium Delta 1]|nr:Putative oxidoreductase YncB [Olavius sp. associated proteobacterium Delta 1]